MLRFTVLFLVLHTATTARASLGSDVRETVERLRHESSYAWVVTTGSESIGPAGGSRSDPRRTGRVIASGRQDRESVAIVTMPSPLLALNVTAVRTSLRAVAQTPLGWLTAEEIDRAYREQQDHGVRFENRTVRLFRCLDAARTVLEQKTPEQELALLINDLGEFAGTRDEITGLLTPAGALSAAFGPAERSSIAKHKLEGSVTFRIRGGRLVEYAVTVTGKAQLPGEPAEREVNHRQVTTISGFSATMVVAPKAAFERLIR